MSNMNPCEFVYRHVLLHTQTLCFLILLLSDHITKTLVQGAYCVVVFTSPLLLLIYGVRYMREEALHWTAIPFLAEAVLTVVFIGAMIYGIRFPDPGGILFAKLLTVYIADAILCVSGYILSENDRLKSR